MEISQKVLHINNDYYANCTPAEFIPKDILYELYSLITWQQTMCIKGDKTKCIECGDSLPKDKNLPPENRLSPYIPIFIKDYVGVGKEVINHIQISTTNITNLTNIKKSQVQVPLGESERLINNCVLCGRLLCLKCLSHTKLGVLLPNFLQDVLLYRVGVGENKGVSVRENGSESIRLCNTCFDILSNSKSVTKEK